MQDLTFSRRRCSRFESSRYYTVPLGKLALKMKALISFLSRESSPHRQNLTSQKTWTFKTVSII
jgi:hypothetical protein